MLCGLRNMQLMIDVAVLIEISYLQNR